LIFGFWLQGCLKFYKDSKGSVIYKEDIANSKLHGLSKEEILVYQIIEQGHNMGVWSKDIRQRAGIPENQMKKVMKELEKRKLVKSIVAISSKNKKVFMLYDLEPHPDISGDIWYTGSEFDTALIEALRTCIYKEICGKDFSTVEEICASIRKSGAFKVDIKVHNIQSIIDTLIFDGRVEEISDPRGPTFLGEKYATGFRATNLSVFRNGYTSVPCGVCPVFNMCSDEGKITPTTCEYFKSWLEF